VPQGVSPERIRYITAEKLAVPDLIFIPALMMLMWFYTVAPPVAVGILGNPADPIG